ncbi:MAG: FG-GAP repeat protein, partial [Gammaproteobacteria bacterium]|nr:FG-GAP repeat protein [Gammaproteobacteria bacterium]
NTPQVVPNFNTFFFGAAVAIDGDTIAVGAPADDSLSSGVNASQSYTTIETFGDNRDTGAVFVFSRSGNSWSQQAYIKASNPTAGGQMGGPNSFFVQGDQFGTTLDLSGNTLVVGVPNEASAASGINANQNDDEAPFAGAVYAFVRNGSAWSQQAYIKASNTGRADGFGTSLDIEGDRLAVGAPNENSNATGLNGDQDNNTIGQAGAAYLFERTASTWQQTDYVKSSNPGFGDQFGFSVALDGDRLLVGANGESSAATGINGDQDDDSNINAGATYLFERLNGQWQQTAYIKASNPDAGDTFGDAVDLDGDRMAIGASRANGVAGGLDADQEDNSVLSSGAVYVFSGVGQAQIVAINQGMNDAWVSEQAPLQGLFFTVYENLGVFFLSWFSFDSQVPVAGPVAVFGAEDQRWVTGSGTFLGNTATLSAELTSGGAFNTDTPLAMQDGAYGTITIVFNSCNEAVLTYNFPGPGLSGQMTLTRVLPSNVPLCESLQTQ